LHYNAAKAVLQTSMRSKHTSPGLMSIKTHIITATFELYMHYVIIYSNKIYHTD